MQEEEDRKNHTDAFSTQPAAASASGSPARRALLAHLARVARVARWALRGGWVARRATLSTLAHALNVLAGAALVAMLGGIVDIYSQLREAWLRT
jgi:hypothetical protein